MESAPATSVAPAVDADRDARDLAGRVAAAIRTHGHFQGTDTTGDRCCLFAGPYGNVVNTAVTSRYLDLLADATGHHLGQLVYWNDTHSTDEVLAVLDAIAAGGSDA